MIEELLKYKSKIKINLTGKPHYLIDQCLIRMSDANVPPSIQDAFVREALSDGYTSLVSACKKYFTITNKAKLIGE